MTDSPLRNAVDRAGESARPYDAQRYESMRGQGAALQQGAQSFVENRQRGQQVEMQQRELQGRMQQVQQELALKQADADMRIQEHQVQMQMLDQKLLMARKLDETDLMQSQVSQARDAARLSRLQVEKLEKESKSGLDEREFADRHFRSRFPGGPRDVFEAGFVIDPNAPAGYRLPKENSDELKLFGERIDQSRGRVGASTKTSEFNSRRNYLSSVLSAAEQAGDLDLRDQALAELRALDPGLAASAKSGASAAAKPGPQVDQASLKATTERVQQALGAYSLHNATGGRSAAGGTVYSGDLIAASMPQNRVAPEVASGIANFVEAHKLVIHDRLTRARTAGGRQWPSATPDETIARLISTLANPSNPDHQAVVNMLTDAGVLPRPQ